MDVHFGRAFTSDERREFAKLTKEAKKELGIRNSRLIAFDFGMPASQKEGLDTGIGSTWSKSGEDFLMFAKTMFGINAVQLGPEGALNGRNSSPYSSSNFSLGEHIIDPLKLTQLSVPLLSEGDIKLASSKAVVDPRYVYYNKVLGEGSEQGTQETLINKAYLRFKDLPSSDPLKKEYNDFVNANSDWLDKYAIYELLYKNNGYKKFTEWSSYTDRHLFSSKVDEADRKKRIAFLLDNEENADFVNRKKFGQFIADKQQKESKKFLNSQGLKLTGDCLIGFSTQEQWAYQDLFDIGHVLGTHDFRDAEPIANNWGLPAIKYEALIKEANSKSTNKPIHKFLEEKFDKFFERYDAIRLDAAWAYKNPVVLRADDLSHKPCPQDKHGNFKYPYDLKRIIFDLIEKSAKKKYGDDFDRSNVLAELLGPDADPTLDMLKEEELDYALTHVTRWSFEGWGRAEFYNNSDKFDPDTIELGAGNHDFPSLIDLGKKLIEDEHKKEYRKQFGDQAEFLKEDLLLDDDIDTVPKFIDAKFAELQLAKSQFYTYTDVLGIDAEIREYWSPRVPKDFERLYHERAIEGYALNLPDAYAKALSAKGCKDKDLIRKLKNAAAILRQPGVLTTEEADKNFGQGYNRIV